MNILPRRLILPAALLTTGAVLAAPGNSPLVVVRDVGGASAVPYYEPLSVQSPAAGPTLSGAASPPVPTDAHANALDPFPVHSLRLSPGPVVPRSLDVPGLSPIFLVGDDVLSRGWLTEHAQKLRALHAVGFVVEVASRDAFESLERLAAGLTLSPVSGDELAERLKIEHYPVLVTATRLGP